MLAMSVYLEVNVQLMQPRALMKVWIWFHWS